MRPVLCGGAIGFWSQLSDMWCPHCQQDVPAVAVPTGGGRGCARCGKTLMAVTDRSFAAATESDSTMPTERPIETTVAVDQALATSAVDLASPPSWEDWSVDFELQHAAARLHASPASNEPPSLAETLAAAPLVADEPIQFVAVDDGHALAQPWFGRRQKQEPKPPRERRPTLGIVGWTFLSVGVMAAACGGALMAMAYLPGRAGLWDLGIPILLGGNASLLLALLLQIERMGQRGEREAEQLDDVDRQLAEIRFTAAMLGPTRFARPKRNKRRRSA